MSHGLEEVDESDYEVIINETQITSDNATQIHPQIFDDIVIWIDFRNDPDMKVTGSVMIDDPDVYGYNLAERDIFEITSNKSYTGYSLISNNYIVWNRFKFDNGTEEKRDVFVYQQNNNETYSIINDGISYAGSIYKEKITIIRESSIGNYDLYLYNLNTGKEIPIVIGNGEQSKPEIWDNWIVWEDYRNGRSDIYAYNLKLNYELQITNTSNIWDVNPQIYGDNVIWQEVNGTISHGISLYNLTTKKTIKITPRSGDGLIYKNYVIYKNEGIRIYDIENEKTYFLAKGEGYILGDLWENRIVYQKSGDIYLLEFELQPVTTDGNGSDGEEKSIWEQYGFGILAIIILLAILISYIIYRKKKNKKV
jgi:beta propeller repeat protein